MGSHPFGLRAASGSISRLPRARVLRYGICSALVRTGAGPPSFSSPARTTKPVGRFLLTNGGWSSMTIAGQIAEILLLGLDGSGEVQKLVSSPFNEAQPALSPDARWLSVRLRRIRSTGGLPPALSRRRREKCWFPRQGGKTPYGRPVGRTSTTSRGATSCPLTSNPSRLRSWGDLSHSSERSSIGVSATCGTTTSTPTENASSSFARSGVPTSSTSSSTGLVSLSV